MLGERHRPIVREDAIDVLDDVRTTRTDDAAGSAEARVRQRILGAIRRFCRVPVSRTPARPQVALDQRPDCVVRRASRPGHVLGAARVCVINQQQV